MQKTAFEEKEPRINAVLLGKDQNTIEIKITESVDAPG